MTIDEQEKIIKTARRAKYLPHLRKAINRSDIADDTKDDLLHILDMDGDNQACYVYWQLDSDTQKSLLAFIQDASATAPPEETPNPSKEYTVSLTKNEIDMMRDALSFWGAIQTVLTQTHLRRVSQKDRNVIDSALGKLPKLMGEQKEM